MTSYQKIAQALIEAGYLSPANRDASVDVLRKTLTSVEAVQDRAAALADQAEQEDMITGAKEFARQDAAAGDKKDLSIDRAILQDAKNKEEVDQSAIKQAEAEISRQCKRAAKTLVSAGLIDKTYRKNAAIVIEQVWVA